MSTLNLKSVTTIATACALSLASAAAFAGHGDRVGGAGATSGAARAGATTMRGADRSTMRQDTMGASARLATPTATSARPTTMTTAKPTAATAKATTAAHATGQPNASCEDTPNQPGHSISAPGSAFNPDGVAGTHYAGEQPQNSKNPNSVSQYDVACTRPQH